MINSLKDTGKLFDYKKGGFFRSKLYLVLVGILVIVTWALDLPLIGLFVVTALFFVIAITQDSMIGIMPLLATVLLMFANRDNFSEKKYIICIVIAITLCLISPIIFLIRKKQKIRFAPPLVGLGLMFIAAFLGGITNGWLFTTEWLFGLAITGVVFLAYFFISNAIREFDADYLSSAFVMMCMVIAVQIFIYYLRQDDIIASIAQKEINLGWTISNGIGMTLIMIIPFTLYKAAKAKFSLPYITMFFVSFICVLVTMSRGSILVLVVLTVPLLASTIRQSKKPLMAAVYMALCLALISAGYILIKDELTPIFDLLMKMGTGDRGRIPLWEVAIEDFKNNKLFGAGFLVHSDLLAEKIKIYWYHNHIFQMLGNLGIFGMLAFLVHAGQKVYYMLKKPTKFNLFVFYSTIMSAAYGLLNITYYAAYYILLMLIIFAMTENCTRDTKPVDIQELYIK